jgi:hypothetical protein
LQLCSFVRTRTVADVRKGVFFCFRPKNKFPALFRDPVEVFCLFSLFYLQQIASLLRPPSVAYYQ